MEPIEWHRGLDDSRVGRVCAYVFVGSLLGFPVLIATLLVLFLPGILVALAANPPVLVLVVLFALVGGPLSLLYLWPLLSERSQRRPVLRGMSYSELPRVRLVAAAVVGAVVHGFAVWFLRAGPYLVLVLGAVGATLGTWLSLTTGRIDPAEHTLTVRSSQNSRDSSGRTIDMDAWTALSQYQLGSVVLLRPTYAPGVRGVASRLIPIPAWVADAAAPVFDAALDAPAPDPGRPPNPVVAATLVLFGLGCLGLGSAIVLLEVGPPSYRLYLLALAGLFAGVFLVAARREY